MRAIEQRARLEHFEKRLQWRCRKSFAKLGDDASNLERVQRREHAMARQDEPVERGRNRIRQRLESARRPDDHNVSLHPDFSALATYTARERPGDSSQRRIPDSTSGRPISRE